MKNEELNARMERHCKEAIQVQDACNLSGVVHAMAEAVESVCDMANRLGQGTAWKNRHPVLVLFAAKVVHLAGLGDASLGEAYERSHALCEAYARGDGAPEIGRLVIEEEQAQPAGGPRTRSSM